MSEMTTKLHNIIKNINGIDSLEEDNGWFRFDFEDRSFQMGLRKAHWFESQHYDWDDPDRERIYLGVHLGQIDYKHDFEEVFQGIKDANRSLTKFVRLSESDNYFVLMRWIEPEEAEKLPSVLIELLDGLKSEEVLAVTNQYESSGW